MNAESESFEMHICCSVLIVIIYSKQTEKSLHSDSDKKKIVRIENKPNFNSQFPPEFCIVENFFVYSVMRQTLTKIYSVIRQNRTFFCIQYQNKSLNFLFNNKIGDYVERKQISDCTSS